MSSLNQFLIPIVAILSIVFFVRLIFKALFLIWLFQLKEYRFDRLFVHFRETREGRRFFWTRRELVLWLVFATPFFYRFPYVVDIYLILVVLVFGYEAKAFIEEVRKKQLRRPIFTKKAILLTILTLLTVFYLSVPFSSITLMFVDRLLILIVALFVFVLGIVTNVAKTVLIVLAKRKLLQVKNLIVIGVTGSYGKSMTKDLIADFLSEKYNVLKTPGSVNTDLGIALFVLRNHKQDHEVFVVEIGAYKRGEIAAVCEMVRPTIGLLTGINEQHLSLFGSLENTKKAKFELIDSLPNDGMRLFNGDDPILLQTIKTSQVLRTQPARSTFGYSVKQLPVGIKAKNHPFLSNVAAAYLLAQKLGITSKALIAKVEKAVKSLGIKTQKIGDVILLEDTFNTNPNGFTAALDILATYKGKKIVVTPGIIELGSQSDRIHRELGEKIGKICDVAVLTNDNFEQPIREGLKKTDFDMKHLLIPKREELIPTIKNQVQGRTVLLFEGRVPKELLITNY